MKHRILLSFLLLLSIKAVATDQIPEILVYQGNELELFSTPLDSYFKDDKSVKKFRKYLNKQQCSADWNGYLGKWLVEDNKLFLVSLHADACAKNPKKIPLKKIFGKKNRIFASWFTGRLIVPVGNILENEYTGFSPKYENYLIFEVQSGNIVSIEESGL